MYLLDTNIISEMRKVKQGKADNVFTEWLAQVDVDKFYISVVSVMELERGVLRIENKDAKQGEILRNWLDKLLVQMFSGRVLDINHQTAIICANLHVPNKSPENDSWIAATAIQHNLTLITRNTKDFKHANVKLFNPFQAA